MTVRALIPIKALDRAKSRLATALPARQRKWLVLGMLAHVVDMVRGAGVVDEIVLLGPPGTPRLPGVRMMAGGDGGLNADLAGAVPRLGEPGVLLVLSADLPDLVTGDVAALHAATLASGIAIAPDQRGDGTNALGFRSPASIPFAFGANSRERHVELAGPGHIIVDRPGLAFDIDDRAGLCRLPADRRAALMRAGVAVEATASG
ncbi:MAG: 2-phospho-L-lactate guanylyltransferase [Sphingomonadaceae bacterium]|nr:2-phospho-L-lactate guanylyltransferase [Sphingomonadaceae bacterium]